MQGLYGQRTYQPVSSGYVGLRNSSRLDLIEPASLRSEIVSYYETSQANHVWRDQELVTRLHEFRDVAELDLRLAVDADLSGYPFNQVELVRPWAEVPSDLRFETRLRRLGNRAERTLEQTQRLIERNNTLQQSIREALGRGQAGGQ
jgi:hypothetical protein